MRQYMQHVHDQHLPTISLAKKMELEQLKEKTKPKEIKRPEIAPVYRTDSYKKDNRNVNGGVSKSIDWSAYKNSMVKEEKKKPDYIKIDYLRFDSKKELIDMNTGANTRAHSTLDKMSANPTNETKVPVIIKKSESTAVLNHAPRRLQTID